jgi:hypothetical protein
MAGLSSLSLHMLLPELHLSIKFKIIKAIEDDPALAEPTYSNLNQQFKKLIYDPIQATAGKGARTYKIIVIDAVDECVNLHSHLFIG